MATDDPNKAQAVDSPYALMAEPGDASSAGGYRGKDRSGKVMYVPFGDVGKAIKESQFMMDPEERPRYRQEIESNLPTGIGVVNKNAAGQPTFGPTIPPVMASKSTAASADLDRAWRYLKGAGGVYWNAAKGMLQTVSQTPQNEEEKQLAALFPGLLTAARLGPLPLRAEREKAAQIKADLDAKRQSALASGQPELAEKYSIYNRHNPDAVLYWKHLTGGLVPLIGPMVAEGTEGIGQSEATGDVAGALGQATALALMLRGAPAEDFVKGKVTKALPSKVAELANKKIPYLPDPGKYLTETVPRKLISTLIKPGKADLLFGKDPVGAVLREGLTGDLETLGKGVNERLESVGKDIDKLVSSPKYANTPINVGVFSDAFDEAIEKARQSGNDPLVTALQVAQERFMNEWSLRPGQRGLAVANPRNLIMNPVDALNFKRMLANEVHWTQDPLVGAVNEAFGAAFGKVKDALNAKIKGLADLNERYSDLVGARKAITNREMVHNRNTEIPLAEVALVAGGHPLLAAGKWVYQSPGFRTGLAKTLYDPLRRTAVKGVIAGGTAQPKPKNTVLPLSANSDAVDPNNPYASMAEPADANVALPALKTQAAQQNPSTATPPLAPDVTPSGATPSWQQTPQGAYVPATPATPALQPKKQYALYARNKSGHRIGSDDGGATWFDVQTGQRVQ